MDPSWPILWARRRLKMERLGPCPHLPRAPRRLHHSSNCWNAPNHLRRQRNASTACSAELRRNSSRRSSKGNTRPRQTSSTPTQTQHKRTKQRTSAINTCKSCKARNHSRTLRHGRHGRKHIREEPSDLKSKSTTGQSGEDVTATLTSNDSRRSETNTP